MKIKLNNVFKSKQKNKINKRKIISKRTSKPKLKLLKNDDEVLNKQDFNVMIKRVRTGANNKILIEKENIDSVRKINKKETENKSKNEKENKTENKFQNYALLFLMTLLAISSISILLYNNRLENMESYEVFSSVDTNNMPKIDNKDVTYAKKEEVKVEKNNTSSNKQKTSSVKKVKPLEFSKPLDGEIQKIFSNDKVIYSKTLELWKTHDGIDINASIGTKVKSIEKGVIEKIYEDSFYGITIVIDHGQGYKSSYSNLDKKVSVKEKQTITKGKVIGKISNTSIGEIKDEPHLHFMLFKDNNIVDPTYIFK